MKTREFKTAAEARSLERRICRSAAAAAERVAELLDEDDPLLLLAAFKFEPCGRDPLDPDRSLNLIEQVNQTFTYLVSVRAVEFLFREHPEVGPYRVNLGTASGSDVESLDGTVAAEVFAAVHPRNNRKLVKDVEKVAATSAKHRYVFFYSPGEFDRTHVQGVHVVPLSLHDESDDDAEKTTEDT